MGDILEQSVDEKQSTRNGRDLTVGSIPRHLIAFSFPMLIFGIMQNAYQLINAMWVGRGLNADAMAALAASMPIFFVLMASAIGLTMASSILISQSYGARDWERLSRVVRNSYVLTGLVSLICCAIGFFMAEYFLRLINTETDILPMAVSYMRIFMCTMPFMFWMFLIMSMLRGTGDSITPLYFQGASLIATAILDPILMFGWLGLPAFGLNGTALATVISHTVGLVAIVIYLRARNNVIAPVWRDLRLDAEMSLLTLRIGIPSMVQQSLISLGMLVIIGIVNTYGKTAMAAAGFAMRIDGLAFMPSMTIGTAIATLSGQNIGARQYDRVYDIFKWGLLVTCGITMIASLLAIGAPEFLIHMFTKEEEIVILGSQYLRIVGIGYMLLAVMFVCNGVINGAGHTFVTTLISLVSLWIFRIPLAIYLSKSTHSLEGIWHAILISYMVGASINLIYFFSGRWKRAVGVQAARIPDDGRPAEDMNSEERLSVTDFPEA